MFVEMLPLFQCFLPLAKKSGIPVIGTMSLCSFMGPDLILGNPRNPSILPAMSSVVHTEMSFYERIENVIEEVKMKVFYFIEKQFKEKLFKELSSNQDLFNYAISLLFVNNHESILPTAQMPNTINIGGIQVKSALLQPLPEVSTYLYSQDYILKTIQSSNYTYSKSYDWAIARGRAGEYSYPKQSCLPPPPQINIYRPPRMVVDAV